MQTSIPKINTQYYINKQAVEQLLRPQTNKPDDHNNNIYPYLPVSLCDNLIYQNVLLKTCIEILSEDTILNDIHLQINNDTIQETILQFWENSQDELVKQYNDVYSYGFGASEVIFNNHNEPVMLEEIPAETLHITKTKNNQTGEWLYFAVQKISGEPDVKLRLFNREYPEEYDDLPVCFWIGGGRKSNFYDYPIWISAFNHVSASVSLDMLDAQKLADGNLISGILLIKRPPAPIITDGDTVEDTLEEKMENKGSGVFTLELVSQNPNIPLEVQYVQISESNYQYLNELSEKSDKKILAVFKIPKARLLIDDTTESMNSNKTNTLYKIYTKELNNRQRPLEHHMRLFNKIYFEVETNITVDTPVFVDEKEVEADTTIKLFNTGLITLGEAINRILRIFPDIETDEIIDQNNPIYNERYYNGNPLGFADPNLDNLVKEAGDMIDYLKIE